MTGIEDRAADPVDRSSTSWACERRSAQRQRRLRSPTSPSICARPRHRGSGTPGITPSAIGRYIDRTERRSDGGVIADRKVQMDIQ